MTHFIKTRNFCAPPCNEIIQFGDNLWHDEIAKALGTGSRPAREWPQRTETRKVDIHVLDDGAGGLFRLQALVGAVGKFPGDTCVLRTNM